MKKLWIFLILILLVPVPGYSADTKISAFTDGSGSVAGTDYLAGYTTGPANRRFTITSILGLLSGTYQPADADLTTWAGITPGANVGTALAIAVGSAGAVVTNGGALGTPSSGTLTNATGLPISGITGLGTGVGTALAIAVGSAGAPVVNGGALGTPSSGTLTNCTFPTLNQNTTGSAATLTTSRNIGDAAFNGSAAITGDAILDNEDISPTGGTWNLTALTALSLPSVTMGSSATPLARIMDSDAPGADEEVAAIGGAYVDGVDGAENGELNLYAFEAGVRTLYIQADGKNTDVEINKTLAMGANSITMTGSIAATGARSTKGWFTDLESTNMPTVGGTALLTSLTAPVFSTSIEAPFLVVGSAATAADAGAIRLPNAGYIYSEADAAGTDISVIGVDSAEVVQIAASGASGVTITPATTITGNLTVNGGSLTVANVTNDNHLKLTDNAGGRAPTATSWELYPDAGTWKLNQNGTEYAAVLSPTAGQVSFTGPTAARAFALPDAAATILTSNAAVTPAQGGTGVANNAASTWTISGNFATTVTVSATTGVTLPPVAAGTVDTHCTATHDYGAAAVAWTMTAAEAACTYITATNANGAVDAVLPAATPGKTYTVNNATGQVLTFKVTGQTGGTIANAKWGFYTTLAADVAEIYELP